MSRKAREQVFQQLRKIRSRNVEGYSAFDYVSCGHRILGDICHLGGPGGEN
jgi:hypothetical protein